MKITTILPPYNKYNFSEISTYKFLKEVGFYGIDLALYSKVYTADEIYEKGPNFTLNYFKDKLKKITDNGLKITQTHASYRPFNPNDDIDNKWIDYIKRQIEVCNILNCDKIVIHPYRIDSNGNNIERDLLVNKKFIEKMCPILEENKVYGCYENLFSRNLESGEITKTGCSTSKNLLEIVNSVNSIYTVCCLDTGHANLTQASPSQFAKDLGDKLKVVHVHDNYKLSDEHNLLGDGTINFNEFVSALKEIGYNYTFNLEIEYKGTTLTDLKNNVIKGYKTAKSLLENNI